MNIPNQMARLDDPMNPRARSCNEGHYFDADVIEAHHRPRRGTTPVCGYALANKGHDTRAIQGWLGHRSITSMAAYCDRRHVTAALRALAWIRSYSFWNAGVTAMRWLLDIAEGFECRAVSETAAVVLETAGFCVFGRLTGALTTKYNIRMPARAVACWRGQQ
jgi:hypothetical protein